MQAGDARVITGRCFIFVMKYIMLTYIQAGIMFNSSVVEFLRLIHWKRERNLGRKWDKFRRGSQRLVAHVQGRISAVKSGDSHSELPHNSHDGVCNMSAHV